MGGGGWGGGVPVGHAMVTKHEEYGISIVSVVRQCLDDAM